MAEEEFPEKLVTERIAKIHELLERCSTLKKTIEGLTKLKKKLLAELKFLTSLKGSELTLKHPHIKSTNLSFLEAVLETVESESNVTAVFKPFSYVEKSSTQSNCTVDIVGNSGCCWIKVTARNASALHRTWQGQGNFGEKDIFQQAKELLEASNQHPVNYSPPVVIILCCQGITESLAKAFRCMGICVKGKLLPDPEKDALACTCVDDTFTDNRIPVEFYECASINLDVTTMIAYVSALTNGSCGFIFKEAILTTQAREEQHNPVLPKLKAFFKGKKLFACQSAVRDFDAILQTIGGRKEQERARALLGNVTVVEDNPSERSLRVRTSGSIKERSKIIFGTGDSLKAITCTANAAFTRAAATQGVEFTVFIHESRALTEVKECQATMVYPERDVT
ncbi:hypothetical protein pdam_00006375 [Pocillopora damicornis]|uniref:DUF1308 domain-containing protein n=1 Tax=Pocillopora damicornis TaxID=46731 RepID=A0A3M6TR11_POCDA|nr:UPF0415 protein C7orf25-like [Pocillopora damicornis]RMX43694.1 hypothetical protein pdam_00006375 [Pocillopora damicornis]